MRILLVAGEANALVYVLARSRRGRLYLCSSRLPDFFENLKSLANVAVEVLLAENRAKSSGVLDGLAGSLTLIRHHLQMISVKALLSHGN